MGFKIFSIFVPYYGLSIFLGAVIVTITGIILCKKFSLNTDDFLLILSTTGLGAMLGAKILYLIVDFKRINFYKLTDLNYINQLMSSGFVFYGGLIGGAYAFYLCKKIYKIEIKNYASIFVVLIPLSHFFGRIGCHLAGCCYGIRIYTKKFPSRLYQFSNIAPNNITLFPVQLFEAFLNLGLFVFLLYLLLKNKNKILEIYLIFYSIIRFFLEFLRGDIERGNILFLSTSQFISILLIIGSVINIFRRRYE